MDTFSKHNLQKWEIRPGAFASRDPEGHPDDYIVWGAWLHPVTGVEAYCRLVFSGTKAECEQKLAALQKMAARQAEGAGGEP